MANVQIPDALLLKSYVAGDENALATLIKRHQSKIFGFIFSKVSDRDVANDIFQDTFIRVIRTLKSSEYNEEGKFLPWVMRISRNLVIDHFRRNQKLRNLHEDPEFFLAGRIRDNSPTIETKMITDQINIDLHKIMGKLPDDQREVVILRIYQDLSFKEIADLTGVSVNTALGRMRYAVRNLKKIIEKDKIILTN